MSRARRWNDTLGIRAATTQDQIVIAQVEALECAGIEQEIFLKVASPAWQLLHPGCADIPAAIELRHRLRIVERRVDRSIGVQIVQRLKHALGAAVLIQ